MTAANIQWWPRHMLRAISSSFTLGSLNGQVQPIFSARPRVFSDPLEQRFFLTFQSPPMGQDETEYTDSNGRRLIRPSFLEVTGRIDKMRGMAGAVRIFDPMNYRPAWNRANSGTRSTWSGGSTWADGSQWVGNLVPPFVTVDEAATADADSIVVRSLPASVARVLRIGDPFEGIPNGIRPNHGEYHRIVDDVTSTSTGKARLYFQPGMRRSLNPGDTIRLNYPTTVMALSDDRQGEVQRDIVTGQFGITLIEVLPYD